MKTTVRRPKNGIFYFWGALVLLVSYSAWAMLRPLPALQPLLSSQALIVKTPGESLAWPSSQAAVGIINSDILVEHGATATLPIASVAKVITALVVLEQKPLKVGVQGPIITLGPADVALYQHYTANDGSVVPVADGEQISEYQALQALMLPSANNIADSLAIWAFGSLDNYKLAAKNYLKDHLLTNTQIGSDASGLSADSTSTASDLVKLGKLAMLNPALAEIVGQSTASGLPVVGAVKNVNSLIGTDNIVGIKTGNTEQAGGVYLSASKVTIDKKPVTIVTSIIGAPNLYRAMKDSLPLIQSAQKNFSTVSIVKKGQTMGQYNLPWGGSVTAVASKDLAISAWNGDKISAQLDLGHVEMGNAKANQIVGAVRVSARAASDNKLVSLQLETTVPKPSLVWRFTHPGWPL